jgi:hypothetical protein
LEGILIDVNMTFPVTLLFASDLSSLEAARVFSRVAVTVHASANEGNARAGGNSTAAGGE